MHRISNLNILIEILSLFYKEYNLNIELSFEEIKKIDQLLFY